MIGIIPCAGHATRIHGLPKYLLPVGDSYLLAILVKRMQTAGVKHVYIGANSDNYDFVSKYAPDGCTVYLCNTVTMSDTILRARKYAGDEDVLFAMPDTWWSSDLVFRSSQFLLERSDAEVALSLFDTRAEQRAKLGMCRFEDVLWSARTGKVTRIDDKPSSTNLIWAWGAIIWKASFWRHINANDSTIGQAVQRAIDCGAVVDGIAEFGNYYDCGTSDEYFRLIRDTTEVIHATT